MCIERGARGELQSNSTWCHIGSRRWHGAPLHRLALREVITERHTSPDLGHDCGVPPGAPLRTRFVIFRFLRTSSYAIGFLHMQTRMFLCICNGLQAECLRPVFDLGSVVVYYVVLVVDVGVASQ